MAINWPKDITEWHDGDTGYLSVPFTWLLPKARQRVRQRDLFVKRWIVGGPACYLMPQYDLSPAIVRTTCEGVLQRLNPEATRTTTGCVRRCKFCGVKRIEPVFRELDDWPDLPVLCDNNLLAASPRHVERVMERLARLGRADFNQGLDARLLTADHARMIAEIKRPIVRLALDNDGEREAWKNALATVRREWKLHKRRRGRRLVVASYVLVGFDGSPEQDWKRCQFVKRRGVTVEPMWFTELDAMQPNIVTAKQAAMGWTNYKRRELMCWYYQHRTLDVRG